MVEEGQIGAPAPQASALLSQVFRPGGNWGAQRGADRRRHHLSAMPVGAGEGDDASRSGTGHGDRAEAVVGEHWSTVIVGGYSLLTYRGHKHYSLSVQAAPRRELRVRFEHCVDVFDTAKLESLIGRLERVLVGLTAEVEQQS
jgi:hypothetical protein